MLKKFCMVLVVGTLLELPGAATADNVDFSEIADLDAAADAIPEWREKIPVLRGDSIWSIARKYCPSGVTQDQMALALYFSNPDAFAGHNINRLTTGIWLNLPPSVLFAQVTPTDAKELLDKLRSDSAYDAQTLLRRLKKIESTTTQTAMPSANTGAIKLPAPAAITPTAVPAPDTEKTYPAAAATPTQTPQALTSTAARDSVQQPTRLELEPVTLPAATAPQPGAMPTKLDTNQSTAVQDIENSAATTATAVPEPHIDTAATDENTAETDQPAPCVTESCRMALDMKNRLIAIQTELSLLNANLASRQQQPVAAPEGKASAQGGSSDEQSKIDTLASSNSDVLGQTWHSITALNPIAFGSIALAGAVFQLIFSMLIRLIFSFRKTIPASVPPLVVTKTESAPAPDYRTESYQPQPAKPHPAELLKKFEPVILASADEIDELPTIAKKPKATASATAAPVVKKRVEKRDNTIDSLGSRSGSSRKPKAASPQDLVSYANSKAAKAPASKASGIAKIPNQNESGQTTDNSEYGKDDLSLDFGLQDGKLHH